MENVLEPLKGGYITFLLDSWNNNGKHVLKLSKSQVLDICTDPLGIYEPKCSVEVNNDKYGIPFSQIVQTFPPEGYQLKLFPMGN